MKTFQSLELSQEDKLTISRDLKTGKKHSKEYKDDVKEFVSDCMHSSDFLDTDVKKKTNIG
ncbi:hypothetical protein [Virgibacillus sp. CBA3643]|uniref:hypothetical protein n=1 Tax=Virgibacillus sp. CBA3643 TaxID=2942278 RepID=UPI0035A35900